MITHSWSLLSYSWSLSYGLPSCRLPLSSTLKNNGWIDASCQNSFKIRTLRTFTGGWILWRRSPGASDLGIWQFRPWSRTVIWCDCLGSFASISAGCYQLPLGNVNGFRQSLTNSKHQGRHKAYLMVEAHVE